MIWAVLLSYAWLGVNGSELLSRQKRRWIIDSFTIEEENPGPFPYELGEIVVKSSYPLTFELFGQGVEQDPKGVLSIGVSTGIISVHKPVDYEKIHRLKVDLLASRPDGSVDTRLGVDISILDINDNPPRFEKDFFEIIIREDEAQGTTLLTMSASDIDKPDSPNSTFSYEVGTVSPKPSSAEFVVEPSGNLSFKGCLKYEEGDTYKVLVLAKDHGDVVSLSSAATALIHIQGGNNFLPVISGQTGNCTVTEGQVGLVPVRIHVTDKDTKHTPAWNAVYTMEGDTGGNFKIETDPDTNDGVLTVIKAMDFEAGTKRDLRFFVENQMPYYSCEVKARPPSGPWVVDSSIGTKPGDGPQPGSLTVTIDVEDCNEAPMFNVVVHKAMVEENVDVGTYVETVSAVDADLGQDRNFVYQIGYDPEGWLKVDPKTGVIKTAKLPDRESVHVVNNTYNVVIIAVDKGKPPMTGSTSMRLHVVDQNDNVPKLSVNHAVVCIGDGPTMTNLTALDPDNEPFGGPFTFELLGEVKGKWSVNPSYGYEVNLVKEPIVHSGIHTVELKISDRQGDSAVNELTVTVCDCATTSDCRGRHLSTITLSFRVILILLFTLLVLLIILMLACFMTCKKDFSSLKFDLTYRDTLLSSNIETPGTDCKIPNIYRKPSTIISNDNYEHDGYAWGELMHQQTHSFKTAEESFHHQESCIGTKDVQVCSSFRKGHNMSPPMGSWVHGYMYHQSAPSGYMEWQHQGHMQNAARYQNQAGSTKSGFLSEAALKELLNRRLAYVQATEDAVEGYSPHLYADEGDDEDGHELEKMNISEATFDHKQLNELGPRFKDLAAMCRPPNTHL